VTISPSSRSVNHGSTTTFTVTPSTGYTASVAGTCGGTLSGTTYTTNAITANCTVIASATINTYTVTPSYGAHINSVTPNTPQAVNYNSTTAFSINVFDGYSPSVAGTCGGTLSGTTYTTNAITANCTVIISATLLPSCSFGPSGYTKCADENGTCAFTGNANVAYGCYSSFNYLPVASSTSCSYTIFGDPFEGIYKACFYKSVTGTLTPTTGSCTIALGASTCTTNPTLTWTTTNPVATSAVTAALVGSYAAVNVSGNSGSQSTSFVVPYPSRTFYLYNGGLELASSTITASCASGVWDTNTNKCVQQYTVTPSTADSNGSISPNTPQTVNSNGTTSFTVTASDGYLKTVGGTCGGTLSPVDQYTSTYTTNAITANCTVILSSTARTFSVLPLIAGSGTVAPTTCVFGTTVTPVCTPSTGYTTTSCDPSFTCNTDLSNLNIARATFTAIPYTLTIPASGGTGSGTYGGTAAGSVNYGTAVSVTATPTVTAPTSGSKFLSWVASGAASACNGQTTSPCAFTMTGVASVQATYGLITGTLTPTTSSCTIAAGASTCTTNPTLTWATTNPVGTSAVTAALVGSNAAVNVSGNSGSQSTSFVVPYPSRIFYLYNNGIQLATSTITASCAAGTWDGTKCSQLTVTPSAGANGTISPATAQTVNYNATTAFTVTPSTGYTASVAGTCGGSLVGTTYTTNAITANCTVVASFTLNNYTVSASAGSGGTISPSSKSVAHGATATFNVIPNAGYSMSVSGCSGSLSGNTYTTGVITAPCSITASFSQLSYTLNYSAGANGTITGTATQNVNYGSNATAVTAVPNTGYHFESWSEGALHTFTSGTSTFTPPTGVTSVETLVVAGGGGGGSSSAGSGGGGGGGAGGFKYLPSLTITEGQALSVVVGEGGISGIRGSSQNGSNGGNSSLGTLVATGGGYGAKAYGGNGGNGGSGGGGGYNGYVIVKYGGTGVAGEGYDGGATSLLSWAGGAGGGGAGGKGEDNRTSHAGGPGGPGVSNSISGTAVVYARGGGGGTSTSAFSPVNTGQGGDAAYAANIPYAGGSGVVIVKYPITTAVRQDTSVTSSKSPVATFAINTYTVTASVSGSNITITAPLVKTVDHGLTTTYTITPSAGYTASVTGTCGGTLVGTTYTTNAITANCTVIAATGAMVGTLTPSANSCTIALNASTCNVNLTWSTTNPIATSAVTASGMTDVSGNSGGPTAFTVPYAGRIFFLYNNTVKLAETVNITASCLAGAWDGTKCAQNNLIIVSAGGISGTYSAPGTYAVNYGASPVVTAAGWAGYYASIAGGCTAAEGALAASVSCTVTNMTTTKTVTVTYRVSTNALTLNTSTGTGSGTYGGTAAGAVNYGTAVSISATPAASSNFVSWVATGAASACNGQTTSPCAFTMNSAASLTANYILKTYTLRIVSPGNILSPDYAISGPNVDATYTLNYGTTPKVTAEGWLGYYASITGGCTAGPGAESTNVQCTVPAMSSNQTVTVSYAVQGRTLTVTKVDPSGTATVTSTPAGINCGATCSSAYNYNTVVTVTAPAVTNYTATISGGCTAGPSTVSTGTSCVVTMSAAKAVTITYARPTNSLEIISPGRLKSPDYVVTSTPVDVTYQINYGANTSITAEGWAGYTASMSGGCVATGTYQADLTCTITNMTSAKVVTVTYAIASFTVTPSAGANGTISPSTVQTKNYNTTQAFTVTPNTGHTASVAGTCGGTLVGTTYTTNVITANCTVVASFTANTYTVLPLIIGSGTVAPTTCVFGTTVTPVCTPSTGYTTTTCGPSFTCNTDLSNLNIARATFTANSQTLTIPASGGTGSGSYGGTAAGTVSYGTAVSITATPATGSTFTKWVASGVAAACNNQTTSPCAFSMTGNASVQATYTLIPYTLTIPASGGTGSGTYGGTAAGAVNYGTAVSITATPTVTVPTSGSKFLSWVASGAALACNGQTTSPCAFTMTGVASVQALYGQMIGTLSSNVSSCTIGANASTCTTNPTLTWSITNPIGATTAITASGMSDINVMTALTDPKSGTRNTSDTVPWGGRTFHLYNNSIELGGTGVTVTSSCINGFTWSGSLCLIDNVVPNAPTITTANNDIYPGALQTFNLVSTDSDSGDTIVYGVDWDKNGVEDSWTTPALGSGVSNFIDHSWLSIGTKNFQARAKDNHDGLSAWTQYSVEVVDRPVPAQISVFTATPSTIDFGKSATLNWSSADATICTITSNFTPATSIISALQDTTHGSIVLKPVKTTSYTLNCSGAGGDSSPVSRTVTVGVIKPIFNEL
jgi:hypothetical protein